MDYRSDTDTRSTLADLNQDIIDRSHDSGIDIFHAPNSNDLTVVCEYFQDFSTMVCGEDILIEYDRETGKISACVVLDYENNLFNKEPWLRTFLNNSRQATTEEKRYEYRLRLFHALVALATPGLAEVICLAYDEAKKRFEAEINN